MIVQPLSRKSWIVLGSLTALIVLGFFINPVTLLRKHPAISDPISLPITDHRTITDSDSGTVAEPSDTPTEAGLRLGDQAILGRTLDDPLVIDFLMFPVWKDERSFYKFRQVESPYALLQSKSYAKELMLAEDSIGEGQAEHVRALMIVALTSSAAQTQLQSDKEHLEYLQSSNERHLSVSAEDMRLIATANDRLEEWGRFLLAMKHVCWMVRPGTTALVIGLPIDTDLVEVRLLDGNHIGERGFIARKFIQQQQKQK